MRRLLTTILLALPLPLLLAASPRVARAQASVPPDAGAPAAPPPSKATLSPPVLRSRAEATYPPDALRDRRDGAVGVELVVDDTGRVVDARVTAPAGHGFDEAALEAVRRFTFEPARKNGVAIRSTVQLAYEFRPPVPPPPTALAPPPAPIPPLSPPSPPLQQGPNQSTLVLAPRTFSPLDAPPERNAASDSSTAQDELALHPRLRAEDLLDVVPGVFSVQHAGGGKAQQDFARGFNLDHGTDLAFFVDGVPINAVSHAHGQGYSDLHFIIPEAVARVDSTKGTYAADVGDFGTAGSVTFRMADHTDESVAKLELAPSIGHERVVVVESPGFGDRWRMAVAVEAFKENGPFIHPEDFDRLNGYAKVTRVLDAESELSFSAMAYSGSWNMSGVLPARAVCGEGDGTPTPAMYAGASCINRFDSIDPTQGGAAQRFMLLTEYKRRMDPHWELRASAYTLHSNLQLFPNDGIDARFQPDGMLYGSQVEQDDTRTQTGATVRLTHRAVLGGMPMRTTLGLQIRNDDIEAQLHRTQGRVRLDGIDANIPGPIYDGRTNETETGAYVEEEVRPARWLRFVLGARGDRVDAATSNESDTAVDKISGYKGQGQLSPKATAVVTPFDALDVFANYGRGFHSNDARTLILGQATTLLAAATGYEVGTTLRPVPGLSLSAVAFLIDLTSEITIDGDTASTTPSGPTRRYGAELTGRYNFDRRLYADVAFTAAHGRYTDAADVSAGTVYLADAPIRTFSAAVGGRQPIGPYTLLGSVTVRSMSDRYGDQGPTPLVETGWTVVNAELGVRWKHVELVADLLNVADVKWREGQFEVSSRLPSEGPNPPAGISFTPGLPRTLMTHAAVYW
ncbi:MAG TPA: TonB-dependent receptor [Polyangiaceae bacterium]|nr:TonB-dependent receptor [Polyangiaceae bacterium]